MQFLRVTSRLAAYTLVWGLLALNPASGEPPAKRTVIAPGIGSTAVTRPAPVRAFPHADVYSGRKIRYLGMFSPDGRYRELTGWRRWVALHSTPVAAEDTSDLDEKRRYRVPDPVKRPSNQRVVNDNLPTIRSVERVHGQTWLGDFRDAALGFAFGSEPILQTPASLSTDSKGRLIIADPAATTIHVLDPQGRDSFSVVGGEGRRMQSPGSVALDAADNIYVSDCRRSMVLVYAPDGRFLHDIGDFKGETLFDCPTGMALDRREARLYVLDTPQHYLYVMDLDGHVLKKIGKRRGGTGPGEFTKPTDIVLTDHKLAVLDSGGTRVQLFDLQGRFVREFHPAPIDAPPGNRVSGMGTDEAGNMYVTFSTTSTIYVFAQDGRLLSSFGVEGTRPGEFRSPTGIWIDSSNRIYIADTRNLRVQVFQLTEKR